MDVDYEGIGFAISINEAKPILDNLREYGAVISRPKLGIYYEMVSEISAKLNGTPTGARVVQFEPGSDVANKGVQVDDIITKIDDIPLTDSQVIASILEGKKAGDTVKLTVFRPRTNGTGSYFDVTVTLMSEGSTQMQGNP